MTEFTTDTASPQLRETKTPYVSVQIRRQTGFHEKSFSGELADAIRMLTVAGSAGVRIEAVSLSTLMALRAHHFWLRAFADESGAIKLALRDADAVRLIAPIERGVA